MKKSLILFLIALFLFAPSVVFADCSEYTISECESHGCKLNKDKDKCIYSNIPAENDEIKSCGIIDNIPSAIPNITSTIYKILQVVVPVLLVILGSFDLIKAVAAGKEDDIKKNQTIFIKRVISALLVFFVFVIVKFLVSISADDDSKATGTNIIKCAECFIENKCG